MRHRYVIFEWTLNGKRQVGIVRSTIGIEIEALSVLIKIKFQNLIKISLT